MQLVSTQGFDPCNPGSSPGRTFLPIPLCGSFVPVYGRTGDWSSGMIPALGAGGREFDSFFLLRVLRLTLQAKKASNSRAKKSSPMRGSNPRLAG